MRCNSIDLLQPSSLAHDSGRWSVVPELWVIGDCRWCHCPTGPAWILLELWGDVIHNANGNLSWTAIFQILTVSSPILAKFCARDLYGEFFKNLRVIIPRIDLLKIPFCHRHHGKITFWKILNPRFFETKKAVNSQAVKKVRMPRIWSLIILRSEPDRPRTLFHAYVTPVLVLEIVQWFFSFSVNVFVLYGMLLSNIIYMNRKI